MERQRSYRRKYGMTLPAEVIPEEETAKNVYDLIKSTAPTFSSAKLVLNIVEAMIEESKIS